MFTIVSRILHSDQLTNVARTFRLVFAACQRWTLLWVVLLIVQGLLLLGFVVLGILAVKRFQTETNTFGRLRSA